MSSPDTGYERRSLSTDLAAAVAAMVHDQGLEPGAQLEPVKALAARFGVAIPTMREALRQLEAMGGVSLRHGSGVYVGENVHRMVVPNPHSPKPTGDRLIELLQARRIIEPPIAALAAEVQEEAGIRAMTETLAEARRCIEEQDVRLWRVNVDFHRSVAAVAGNSVLTDVIDSIVVVHAQDQREILRLHGDEDQDYAEHKEITDLVLAGDVDGARQAAEAHLDNVIEIVSRRLANET
jgi:GntR family transcriptional regulator, transcriptional repressor for pyruvate dehydrogenase complex